MPFISGAIAAITAVASTFFTVASITTFALQMAAGIGLSYLVQAIKGKPAQQTVGIQGKLAAGGDVPRSILFGRYNTAGSLVYRGTWGQSGDTPNAFYVEVRALADVPTKSMFEAWVDGENVDLIDGIYGLTSSQHIRRGTKFGDVQNLWFRFYDGTQTSADSELVFRLAGNERPYGADRIGKGTTYVVITAQRNDLDKDNPMFNGFPQCKFTVDGMRLYDISKDSTAGGSGSHRWADPSTWGGDGDYLPAVQIYNILRGITVNGKWLYGLQAASPAILPAENWIPAINKCRTLVDGPDGLEPQYRTAAQINVSTPPLDAIQALCKGCQGRVVEVGGVYKMYLGAPDTPVMSFSDDDIITTAEQSYSPFLPLTDSINGVVAKYPEPVEGWNIKTAPPYLDPDFEAGR